MIWRSRFLAIWRSRLPAATWRSCRRQLGGAAGGNLEEEQQAATWKRGSRAAGGHQEKMRTRWWRKTPDLKCCACVGFILCVCNILNSGGCGCKHVFSMPRVNLFGLEPFRVGGSTYYGAKREQQSKLATRKL